MTFELLIQGVLVGALAVFPLGPMGLVCVRRTLTQGAVAGVVSAGGLALATAVWCLVAVRGLGVLGMHLTLDGGVFRLVLGVFLTVLAVAQLRGCSAPAPGDPGGGRLAGQFLSILLVVLPNPLTLVTVTALLAAFGVGRLKLGWGGTCVFSLAVLIGGLVFWGLLAGLLTGVRRRIGEAATARVRWGLSLATLLLGAGYLMAACWPGG